MAQKVDLGVSYLIKFEYGLGCYHVVICRTERQGTHTVFITLILMRLRLNIAPVEQLIDCWVCCTRIASYQPNCSINKHVAGVVVALSFTWSKHWLYFNIMTLAMNFPNVSFLRYNLWSWNYHICRHTNTKRLTFIF